MSKILLKLDKQKIRIVKECYFYTDANLKNFYVFAKKRNYPESIFKDLDFLISLEKKMGINLPFEFYAHLNPDKKVADKSIKRWNYEALLQYKEDESVVGWFRYYRKAEILKQRGVFCFDEANDTHRIVLERDVKYNGDWKFFLYGMMRLKMMRLFHQALSLIQQETNLEVNLREILFSAQDLEENKVLSSWFKESLHEEQDDDKEESKENKEENQEPGKAPGT